LLLARISPALLILLSTVLLLLLLISASLPIVLRHLGWATSQIDVKPARILFGSVPQAEFLTDSLDARFQFLDVVGRVVASAYDAALAPQSTFC